MKNWIKKVYKFVLSGTPVHHLNVLPDDKGDALVFKQTMMVPVISLHDYLEILNEEEDEKDIDSRRRS